MKILYKILDYTISVLMGVSTLLLVSLVVGKDWNMFFAMFVGMILGIVVLLIIVMIFISISTVFELFPAGMLTTIFTGMATGMILTKTETNFTMMLVVIIAYSFLFSIVIDLYIIILKCDITIDQ